MDTNRMFKVLAAIAFSLLLFGSAAAMSIPHPGPGPMIPTTTITVSPSGTQPTPDSIVTYKDGDPSKTLTDTDSDPKTATYTGVEPGTYIVKVTMLAGYADFTGIAYVQTTPTPQTVSYTLTAVPLEAPTNLTATLDSAKEIVLSWTDNSAREDNYVLFKDGNPYITLGANTVTYTDKAAVDGNTYSYKVQAYDNVSGTDVYSDFSNTATITVQTSLAKPVLTATALGPTKIQLNWADLPNERLYTLEKGISGVWTQIAALPKDAITYTDTAVTPESTVSYRLTATNLFGTATSDELAVTAPAESLAATATIKDVDAGETSDISVTVTNWLGYDIKNVAGTITISDLGISEDVSKFSLAAGASKTIKISADVPTDTEANDYDVSADLDWENSAGDSDQNSYDLGTLSVNKLTHAIALTDVFQTSTSVNAGDEIKVMLDVKNTGSNAEKVTLKLYNVDLGAETLSLTVPKGETVPAIIKLAVPEDAKSGSYQLSLSASYSSKTATADTLVVSVKGATQTIVTPATTITSGTTGNNGLPEQVPLWVVALLIGLGVILAVEIALRAQYSRAVAAQNY